ncbi:hypothetical protein [Paenibacillus plantarum]|uniref:hypothetical protein n=1 Tax=Paenibacillus plantarum TaxID=2654975 RepID=UPI001FEA7E30|nr:hypothetical protein [Paenibacillus plantarum]
MNIIDTLLDDPPNTSLDLESLIHNSLKKKLFELELATQGFMTPEQAGKIMVIKRHFEDFESRKPSLESIILSPDEYYTEELNLILTVPSMKKPIFRHSRGFRDRC